MPGCIMGLARLNRPGLFIYGGTIKPGEGHTDMISVFEAVGQYAKGEINAIQVKHIEEVSLPARAPVAACIRPTRWPLQLKHLA